MSDGSSAPTVAPADPVPRRSLSDSAYLQIRDLLITVRIRPGDPVSEEHLAKQLDVGRTPVREAIKRLKGERLVNIYPRRGVFATDVHITDLSRLTEVRTHLEGQAAFLSARRATPEQRETLRGIVAGAASGGLAATDQIDLDSAVHRFIYQCAHNSYLAGTLDQYYNLILRIWYLFLDRLPELTDHVNELLPIVGAIIDGNAEDARRLMIEHVSDFERAVLAVM